MKRLLITGGPVHAHLDAVKIITNKFKGGLMADLIKQFFSGLGGYNCSVTYLTSKDAIQPNVPFALDLTVVHHNGFQDYRQKVLELSKDMDGVILGAAVANLIPLHPLEGKFPSHNYKVGDVIPIDFTIAPRVIDEVKKVNPKVHLFGFKLLSGVPHDELISAAYGVLLESKATAVFANDAKDLTTKYAVTKERGEHTMDNRGIADFVMDCLNDEYYKTIPIESTSDKVHHYNVLVDTFSTFVFLFDKYKHEFYETEEGYVFGTVAMRNKNGGFFTTGRGKKELDGMVFVLNVDHKSRVVESLNEKPSLNTPLLDWIFKTNPKVKAIVHLHNFDGLSYVPVLPYAIPGTVKDSKRDIHTSFIIEGHGTFLLLDDKLNII
jgi:hypothetical protein